jgi:hypothetical protein
VFFRGLSFAPDFDNDNAKFARYLAQEIHSGSSTPSTMPGSSDDDDDSEEEMEGGWLSQSRFDLPSSLAARRRSAEGERRPLEAPHGFDVGCYLPSKS